MKFDAWLGHRADKTKNHNRISHQIMKGSHNFPYHSTSNSLVIFCKKNNYSDHVKDALLKSWAEFEGVAVKPIRNESK